MFFLLFFNHSIGREISQISLQRENDLDLNPLLFRRSNIFFSLLFSRINTINKRYSRKNWSYHSLLCFHIFVVVVYLFVNLKKVEWKKSCNKEDDFRDTGVYASGAAGQCCRKDLGEDKEILSPPWSFPPSSTISPSSLFLSSPLTPSQGLAVIAVMQVWPNRAHVNSNDKLQLPNATPRIPSPSKKRKGKKLRSPCCWFLPNR